MISISIAIHTSNTTFLKHLPCARHGSRCQRHRREQEEVPALKGRPIIPARWAPPPPPRLLLHPSPSPLSPNAHTGCSSEKLLLTSGPWHLLCPPPGAPFPLNVRSSVRPSLPILLKMAGAQHPLPSSPACVFSPHSPLTLYTILFIGCRPFTAPCSLRLGHSRLIPQLGTGMEEGRE